MVMTRKEIISLIVASIAVIGVIVVGIVEKRSEEIPGRTDTVPETTDLLNEGDEFSFDVPDNAVLTTPVEEIPVIDAGTGEQKGRVGVFAITATKNGYEPETVTVKLGDVVNLELTSRGGRYDMFSPYLGFHLTAGDGETKQLSFKAGLSGTFSFECRDSCPANGKITGQLIVLPQE